MTRLVDYIYIFATIGFTVYGQLILKWRIADFGSLPVGQVEKLKFLTSLLLDPLIFSGFAAAFLAGAFFAVDFFFAVFFAEVFFFETAMVVLIYKSIQSTHYSEQSA